MFANVRRGAVGAWAVRAARCLFKVKRPALQSWSKTLTLCWRITLFHKYVIFGLNSLTACPHSWNPGKTSLTISADCRFINIFALTSDRWQHLTGLQEAESSNVRKIMFSDLTRKLRTQFLKNVSSVVRNCKISISNQSRIR